MFSAEVSSPVHRGLLRASVVGICTALVVVSSMFGMPAHGAPGHAPTTHEAASALTGSPAGEQPGNTEAAGASDTQATDSAPAAPQPTATLAGDKSAPVDEAAGATPAEFEPPAVGEDPVSADGEVDDAADDEETGADDATGGDEVLSETAPATGPQPRSSHSPFRQAQYQRQLSCWYTAYSLDRNGAIRNVTSNTLQDGTPLAPLPQIEAGSRMDALGIAPNGSYAMAVENRTQGSVNAAEAIRLWKYTPATATWEMQRGPGGRGSEIPRF